MDGQKKKTYYISIATGEISQSATSSPWNFKIEATDEEIIQLREYFDENYNNELSTYVRAHIPYVEYHHDKANDAYDDMMQKIYSLIYELGDNEAKNHIDSMGILNQAPNP
ncbi:hydrolase [Bacillus sp. FJAT-27225]|uniref:hydrolase n=1 Tax=Bacillus sp. FJAT-27225 TaxID=1743144 RepID=UPI00080C316F|nr:hydrolase [Bacillus sp. FJAT-27225]OCA91460.1 hydrolase [Bacillus sp. FJAT-27225]